MESHLLQMRGLKQQDQKYDDAQRMSHLLQMRGLKRYDALNMPEYLGSHLLQMRGLKLRKNGLLVFRTCRIFYRCVDWNRLNANRTIRRHQVASFTDAWIETADNTEEYQPPFVASFTDAWIETGLKESRRSRYVVASFTDAWIETVIRKSLKAVLMVASFTDAWIETWSCKCYLSIIEVASFTDAWIETLQTWVVLLPFCRIFYRCVDWNLLRILRIYLRSKSHLLQMRGLKLNGKKTYNRWISRIFYRCVDWNSNREHIIDTTRVASFTDAWIETLRYQP